MSKVVVDGIDRKILRLLIQNARMPFLEIARECGVSGAAIHQRIRKLEAAGVLLGSRLEVDPKKLGFDVCAFISISISDNSLQMQMVERLRHIPEVVECHFITGTYNVMVKLYCVDNDHLMSTIFNHILSIPGVSSTQTYISLNELFSRQVCIDKIL